MTGCCRMGRDVLIAYGTFSMHGGVTAKGMMKARARRGQRAGVGELWSKKGSGGMLHHDLCLVQEALDAPQWR